MSDTNEPPTIAAEHIDETILAMARLRAGHHLRTSPLRRAVERITTVLARPRFLVALTVVVAGWILVNLPISAFAVPAFDPPPFVWLTSGATLVPLLMVVLVLITQRGEDRLAQDREMLILELALLGERKITKVISLLEEGRRDNPLIVDRDDAEAESMTRPVDPTAALAAIKVTHVSVPE